MSDSAVIKVGSHVTLKDLDSGRVLTHKIVLDGDADPSRGLLSMDSCLGRSLLDRYEGARLTIAVAGHLRSVEVLEVTYAPHFFGAGHRYYQDR